MPIGATTIYIRLCGFRNVSVKDCLSHRLLFVPQTILPVTIIILESRDGRKVRAVEYVTFE